MTPEEHRKAVEAELVEIVEYFKEGNKSNVDPLVRAAWQDAADEIETLLYKFFGRDAREEKKRDGGNLSK